MTTTGTKRARIVNRNIGRRFVTQGRGMSFEDAVENFVRNRKMGQPPAKGPAKERTIFEYRADLKYFVDFMTQVKKFTNYNDMEKRDVDDFILHIRDRKRPADRGGQAWSDSSKNKVFRSLRALFYWVHSDSECKDAGMEHFLDSLPIIGKADRRVWIPSREMVHSLLLSFDERLFWGLRDRLIVSVLIECGPRNGELCNLMVGDVLPTGHLRLFGKTGERIAPIDSETTMPLMRRYLLNREDVAGKDEKHLFITRNGHPMEDDTIVQVFEDRRRKGFGKDSRGNVSAHVLRHYFATHYIVSGGSPQVLQQILGHTTMDMVNVYMHLANEIKFVKDDHAKVSPLKTLLAEFGGKRKKR